MSLDKKLEKLKSTLEELVKSSHSKKDKKSIKLNMPNSALQQEDHPKKLSEKEAMRMVKEENVNTEVVDILPNGQWLLRKAKESQLYPPKDVKARIKERAVSEFKDRMKDVINFYHKKQEAIPSRLILLREGMPYRHPSLTNKERLEIFQNVAKDLGLHPNYPIHYDHDPNIDEQEFNLPKGQRLTVSIPKDINVKLDLPSSNKQQKPELYRQGFGGYILPKK